MKVTCLRKNVSISPKPTDERSMLGRLVEKAGVRSWKVQWLTPLYENVKSVVSSRILKAVGEEEKQKRGVDAINEDGKVEDDKHEAERPSRLPEGKEEEGGGEAEMDPQAVAEAKIDSEEKKRANDPDENSVVVTSSAGVSMTWSPVDVVRRDARLEVEGKHDYCPDVLFTQGDVGRYIQGLGALPAHFREREAKPFHTYFLLAFPLQEMNNIIEATNANMPPRKKKMDMHNFFKFLGALIAILMTLLKLSTKRKYFEPLKANSSTSLNPYMGLQRFIPPRWKNNTGYTSKYSV